IRTSKFKVDTAWVGTQLTVDLEEALYFIQDLVEVTGLVAIRGSKSIAVHRVRLPDHLVARVFHRAHNIRKHCADAVVGHLRDYRVAPPLACRVLFCRTRDSFVCGYARANLETNRVADQGREVDVQVFHPAGTLTHPHLVCR